MHHLIPDVVPIHFIGEHMKITRYHIIASLIFIFSVAFAQNAPAASPWSGCYVGVNVGYGWADISGHQPDINSDIGSATVKGGAFGGQFGCDYQTANWVFGGQLSLNKTNMTGDHLFINGSGPSNVVTYDIKYLGTITGRFGYTFNSNVLAYMKAGGAWTRTRYQDNDPAPLFSIPYTGSEEVSRFGWVAAVGLEYRIAEHFSTCIEYNYMDFGREKATIQYSDGVIVEYSFRQNLQYLSLGVNYRF